MTVTNPSFWMTHESKFRLENQGGNCKGAVPVHGTRSNTANIPLYDQAAMDAAIAAEREACAKVCEEQSETGAHIRCAAAIRARSTKEG
jgi:hypothetical protein